MTGNGPQTAFLWQSGGVFVLVCAWKMACEWRFCGIETAESNAEPSLVGGGAWEF
jgi:hypothetical protein